MLPFRQKSRKNFLQGIFKIFVEHKTIPEDIHPYTVDEKCKKKSVYMG